MAEKLLAKRRSYAWAWRLWVVAFGVLELKAILDDDEEEGDFTLSHFTRRLAKSSWIFRAAIIALLAWLGPIGLDHFDLI